jgi:HAD superfamily hydrolase (TIGR01509 family)
VDAPLALLVDLGETLFSERPFGYRTAAEALVAEPRLAPFLATRDVDAIQRAHEEGAGRVRETNEPAWTVRGFLRGLMPAAPRPLVDEAELLVWRHAARMSPLPGAREALAALRRAGVRTGVVSNTLFSARALSCHLRDHELAVDFVLSSADLGARKPDPAIFRAALGYLRAPAPRVWFVGDSLEKDVLGAAAVGIRPVWFGGGAPPRAPTPSCAVARDWPAVMELLSASPS